MILKKLILKEWFRSFLTSSLILFILASVAQLISNLLQTKDTAEALYNYIFLVPWLLNKILAVCCLFASLFSLNKLINRNELVAIFASGFTRKKFLITIFQASMVVALFQFMVNGFLGPKAAYEKKIKEATKTKLFKGKELRQTFLKKGKFWHKGEDYFLSFGIFDPSKSDVLQNIYLLKFNKNFAITKGIFAKKAHYHKDKTWIFLNAKVISNLNQNDFPEVEERASMEVLLAETPEDFNQLRSFIPTLNFFELKNYIDRMKKVDINTAEFEVIYPLRQKLNLHLSLHSHLLVFLLLLLRAWKKLQSKRLPGNLYGSRILPTASRWIFL
jgi:lipopolysaccharide export system permease protein